MAFVVRAAREPASGDVATPHELNAEMAAILAEVNGGLDRENINGEQITDAKVADSELHHVEMDDTAGATTANIGDSLLPGQTFPVPDGSGDPLTYDFTLTEAAQVRISFSSSVQLFGGMVTFYVFVSGAEWVRLDAGPDDIGWAPISIDACDVLPPGTYTVELRYGIGLLFFSGNVEWQERILIVDWVHR